MIEFKVMTARQGRDGQSDKAIVCASYAEGWVADDLNRDYRLVRALPLEVHWSAQVLSGREFSDLDTRTEGQ